MAYYGLILTVTVTSAVRHGACRHHQLKRYHLDLFVECLRAGNILKEKTLTVALHFFSRPHLQM